MNLRETLTALADALREGADYPHPMTLDEMPYWARECHFQGKLQGRTEGYTEGYGAGRTKGDQEGYDRGLAEGKAFTYDVGYSEGKQAEYDAFWDNYQDNGKRTGGYLMFAGYGWNSENYKPKYKVAFGASVYPNYPTMMFERFDNLLKYAPLEINEGDIDFSKATALEYSFRNANVSKVEMDCIPPNLTSMKSTFHMNSISSHNLTTLKLGVNASTTYDATCFTVNSLRNVSFIEGSVIGNTISFSSKVLTKESITNIMKALSTTTSGKTFSLSLTAVDKAFETSEGANDGHWSEEWDLLISARTNWSFTIS